MACAPVQPVAGNPGTAGAGAHIRGNWADSRAQGGFRGQFGSGSDREGRNGIPGSMDARGTATADTRGVRTRWHGMVEADQGGAAGGGQLRGNPFGCGEDPKREETGY